MLRPYSAGLLMKYLSNTRLLKVAHCKAGSQAVFKTCWDMHNRPHNIYRPYKDVTLVELLLLAYFYNPIIMKERGQDDSGEGCE